MTADTSLRPELTSLPDRIAKLRTYRGYPVPYFVPWVDGEPDFRFADAKRRARAIRQHLCWGCGEVLGKHLAFLAGPMCTVTRTSMEPPMHRECAIWSVKNCPFLVRPHMIRREGDRPEEVSCPGHMIERNPGVTALWTTLTYRLFRDDTGGVLIEMGIPQSIEWFREGRDATLAEVEESIRTGLPHLEKLAGDDAEIADLHQRVVALRVLMPAS